MGKLHLAQIGLVVPSYRESERLPRFLPELCEAMSRLDGQVCVLVVDDGSGLEETRVVEELCKKLRVSYPCLLPPLLLDQNTGKGGAIRKGWDLLSRRSELRGLAFVDADGACNSEETFRLIRLFLSQSEDRSISFFSARVRMLGREIFRSPFRHAIGRVFASLVSVSLKIPVYDSQCGLKVIPAESYRLIKNKLTENGFGFDVDLLAGLLSKDQEVREIPIDWSDVPGSKVRLVRDSWRMLQTVRHVKKKYQ